MALFGTKPKVRRPVADIVAGLEIMVADLEESGIEAHQEQLSAEDAIVTLQTERKFLINEQKLTGSISDNLRSLLGKDLDDGGPDDLDRAIAGFTAAPEVEVEAETVNDDQL